VLGNTLYVIGGGTSGGATSAVDQATINPDGTIGDFQASTVTLKMPRMAHASFIYNNDYYVLGGRTSEDFSTYTNTIERAHIGADGSLGPFETLGLTLDVPRGYLTAAVIDRALYVFAGVTNGGATSPTFVDTVKTTQLETTSGILAPFATHSTLPDPRAFHANLVLSSKVSLLTGKTSFGYLAGGVDAPIAADGAVGAWATSVQSPTTREGGVLVAVGDAVFAIGGINTAGFQSTQRSEPDAADVLSPFVAPTSGALAKPRFGHAAVTIGNRIYVLGGVDGTNLLDSFESTMIR
jgi:hypothetical protein